MAHEPSANNDFSNELSNDHQRGTLGTRPMNDAKRSFSRQNQPDAATASHDNVSLLSKVKQADQRRPGLPGEHWAVFGVALGLLRLAHRSSSSLLKWTAGAAGSAMLVRALSGRDGPLHKVSEKRKSIP